MDNYDLTAEQMKVFKKLKRVLSECSKLGIYIWDDYGTISAVNGNIVNGVVPDENIGEELDRSQVESIYEKCWKGSNADDTLFVELK